jgi:hypothetical protein
MAAYLIIKTANPLAPSFYLIAIAIITFLVVVFFLPETSKKSLA